MDLTDGGAMDPAREARYESELRGLVLSIVGDMACEVFLFGSRAQGRTRRSSDFDIGIQGLTEAEFREVRSRIEDAVDESNIPHSVDVVDFDRSSPAFRSEALRQREIWKSASALS